MCSAAAEIEVVSGYRHPKFAKNPRSPHMKGLACDMRVVGVKNTELRDFFRQRFKNVGVGYYPNSSFVHLDVRRGASAFWIDYSGPGENALYADNALEDLRSWQWNPSVYNVAEPFAPPVAICELIPTTSPCAPISGPPELPGLIDASVWM